MQSRLHRTCILQESISECFNAVSTELAFYLYCTFDLIEEDMFVRYLLLITSIITQNIYKRTLGGSLKTINNKLVTLWFVALLFLEAGTILQGSKICRK